MNPAQRHTLIKLVILAIVALMLTLAPPPPAHPMDGGDWLPAPQSAPTNPTERAAYASLAIDGDTLYVLWHALSEDLRTAELRYTYGTLVVVGDGAQVNEWAPVVNPAPGLRADTRNRAKLAAHGGQAWLAFGDSRGNWRLHTAPTGQPWQQAHTAPMTGGNSSNFGIALALDEQGAPTYCYATGFGGSMDIACRAAADGYTERRLYSAGYLARSLDIAAHDGVLSVVWEGKQNERAPTFAVYLNGNEFRASADLPSISDDGQYISYSRRLNAGGYAADVRHRSGMLVGSVGSSSAWGRETQVATGAGTVRLLWAELTPEVWTSTAIATEWSIGTGQQLRQQPLSVAPDADFYTYADGNDYYAVAWTPPSWGGVRYSAEYRPVRPDGLHVFLPVVGR